MASDWTEVTISVPTKDLETAEAIMQMAAPGGLYIEDYSDLEEEVPKIAHIDLIDEDLLARPRDRALIHIFLAESDNPAEAAVFIGERLAAAQIDYQLERETVSDADWADGWKRYFHPLKVSDRIVVRPTWEDYSPAPDEIVLSIDPGMAFGTGSHATTALCLRAIDRNLQPGDRVLDMGCGSGILLIAALLLGASEAAGVEIDATAARIAGENAILNGLGPDRVTIYNGNILADPLLADQLEGDYDLICANIVADVVIPMAPYFFRYAREGGLLIASGIIEERLDSVREALEAAGLRVRAIDHEDGWAAITAERPTR